MAVVAVAEEAAGRIATYLTVILTRTLTTAECLSGSICPLTLAMLRTLWTAPKLMRN
jgi:hypothetical protein